MPSKTHSNGWISVNISESHEDKAKEMRARRDCLYGNIFQEESSDLRWSGDLGEYAFKSWLNHEGVSDYNWLTGDNDATGNADFEIRKCGCSEQFIKISLQSKRNSMARVSKFTHITLFGRSMEF